MCDSPVTDPLCVQLRFTELMHEKADLKERLEELEHRCIQLSGETDTIGMCGQHQHGQSLLSASFMWGTGPQTAFAAGALKLPSLPCLLLLPNWARSPLQAWVSWVLMPHTSLWGL